MNKTETREVTSAERTVLVFVNPDPGEDEYVEQELRELAKTAGLEVVAEFRQRRPSAERATYLGKGKTEELFVHVQDLKADVAIIDDELSPIQQRNLEDLLKVKVIDRPQLILDIFAQRAHTREGILQVELAQLNYLLPRISSLYTRFERQQGGIGVRGPGETKLESDRRVIKQRISRLSEDLDDVRKRRHHQREARRRYPFPFGAIIGYTSAGKSTLINTLSGAEVYTDAKLFATLDPTTRRVVLPDGYSIFLTDTVGFIRNLPTNLIAAFRATLEEVTEADYLLHVLDVSHPKWESQRDVVMETLEALGAGDKPVLTVYNKVDLVQDQYFLRELVANTPNSVYISALKAQGIGALMDGITRTVRGLLEPVEALIPYDNSSLVSDCYEFGRVEKVDYRDDGIFVKAEVVKEMAGRLRHYRIDQTAAS